MSALAVRFLLFNSVLLIAADHPSQLSRQSRRGTQITGATSEALKSDVNMVLVPVSVTDQNGRSVLGLGPGNFKILDEGSEQTIRSFSSEDVPVSVGVVLDTSGSMYHTLAQARIGTRVFVELANPEDESFLVTFANKPQPVSGFTRDLSQIRNALFFRNAEGSTPLIDGIWMALGQMRSALYPRKALLVLSDGGDNNSRHTQPELLAAALEADTQIYSVIIGGSPRTLTEQAENARGASLLQQLATRTGGGYFPIRDPHGFSALMSKISRMLRDRYVLGYYPPAAALKGKWRRIAVNLNVPRSQARLHVDARKGYYTQPR